MTSERWRCFVAVPVPSAVRTALAAAVDGWRRRPDLSGLRWSAPDRWHLTLAFLGNVTPSEADDVARAIDRVVATLQPIRSGTSGLGGFPRASGARVAWMGVEDAAGALARATVLLRAELQVEDGAAFRPHLTLARARSQPVDLRTWISDAGSDVPRVRFDMDRVELIRSHLGSGSRYEILHVVRMGAAVAHA